MRKVNISTKKIEKYAGKWVAIDTTKNRIIAVGETLKEIEPLTTRSTNDKTPDEEIASAFKVPRKDEGPYVLCTRKTVR